MVYHQGADNSKTDQVSIIVASHAFLSSLRLFFSLSETANTALTIVYVHSSQFTRSSLIGPQARHSQLERVYQSDTQLFGSLCKQTED